MILEDEQSISSLAWLMNFTVNNKHTTLHTCCKNTCHSHFLYRYNKLKTKLCLYCQAKQSIGLVITALGQTVAHLDNCWALVQSDYTRRFWATVRFPMLSVHCLSVCLSVTLVYCGQTFGWIKTKPGMQVGLGPGHTVRWGPTSRPLKGHSPQFSAHICCG